MKLTSKTDFDVPAGVVYDLLADHPAWVEEARRRGADIEPSADRPMTGIGAGWQVRFPFRGKTRKVQVWVEDMQPGQLLTFAFQGQAFEGGVVMEILALSARRTRLRVGLTVKPRTLAARLFLNTLRLGRRKVQARFDMRLGQLAAMIESRHAQSRVG